VAKLSITTTPDTAVLIFGARGRDAFVDFRLMLDQKRIRYDAQAVGDTLTITLSIDAMERLLGRADTA